MSLFVTLAADVLVAILLAATIVTTVRLSGRISQLKGDEAAFRKTIGDLIGATDTAERAIAGLRAALDECDRTLNARIDDAGTRAAQLAAQVEAGEDVVQRIGAIVAQMRDPGPGPAAASRPHRDPAPARQAEPARRPEPESPNDERLGAAAAAARAMTERALARVRTRAA